MKMIRKNGNKRKTIWYHNFHESIMEEMPTSHALGLTKYTDKLPLQLSPLLDHESNPFLIKIPLTYIE